MAIYLQNSSGINGEAADTKFKNSIELISFGQGISQAKSAVVGSSGGNSATKSELADIVVTKYLDSSSPKLYQACASGQTIGSVTISFVRADSTSSGSSNPITYLTVTLKNVMISSISTNLSNENQLPIDSVGLRFTAIQWAYNQQNLSGGQGGNVQTAWSSAQNTPTFS